MEYVNISSNPGSGQESIMTTATKVVGVGYKEM